MNKKEFILEDRTHIRTDNSTKKLTLYLFIVLILFSLFALVKNGLIPYLDGETSFGMTFYPLLFLFITTVTSFFTEFIIRNIKQLSYESNIFISLNTGLLLGLILPFATPIYLAFIASVISMTSYIIMEEYTKKIRVPAPLVGWLFITILIKLGVISNTVFFNDIELFKVLPEKLLSSKDVLNSGQLLFTKFGTNTDFIFGLIPGGMGTTCILLSLIVFLYFVLNKLTKWIVPVVSLFIVFIMSTIIGSFAGYDYWYPLFHLCSGSLFFALILLGGDLKTSPVTEVGQIFYGIIIGILTIIFRMYILIPGSAFLAIIIVSLFRKPLDYIGGISRFKFYKSIPYFIILWISIILISVYIGLNFFN